MVFAWPYHLESALVFLVSMVSTHCALFVHLHTHNMCLYSLRSYVDVGAGKTTTFSILTGDFPMSSGTALIAGYNIKSHLRDVSLYYKRIVIMTFQ